MGDALLQKSYTTDTLPFRKKRNHGEKARYYVENSNPPIVSRETFQAAQELQKKQSNGKSNFQAPISLQRYAEMPCLRSHLPQADRKRHSILATYDDLIVRQILQSVIVESKQKIKVIFLGGLEMEAEVEQ